MTTPTGIPVTLCTDCNREHPVTRQHCPVCGLASLFGHESCIVAPEQDALPIGEG